MSYWVYLRNQDDDVVCVENHSEGGTYRLGGADIAELNVTYNYARCWWPVWTAMGAPTDGHGDGSLGKMIGGKRAVDTIPWLRQTVDILGTARDEDYWNPTNGNAGYALSILLNWAEQYPEATWEVS